MDDMFYVRSARAPPPPPAPEAMGPALPVHLPHLALRCDSHMPLHGLAARTSRPASHVSLE